MLSPSFRPSSLPRSGRNPGTFSTGADRECTQIEIACGGDEPDLDRDLAIIESWNTHVEAVADLERPYQVLPQIEVDPHVVQVNESYQWHARRYIFARLNVALVDLRSHWRIDQHLVDDRLNGRDVSRRLLSRWPQRFRALPWCSRL